MPKPSFDNRHCEEAARRRGNPALREQEMDCHARKSSLAMTDDIHEIIRVNHAGEYGAKRIYEGQIRFTKDSVNNRLIRSMLQHELVHLEYFENALKTRRVRPTLLLPLWHRAGYLLGAISAKFGINNAMLVTQNVEEVIEDHYKAQIKRLTANEETTLASDIQKFMDDEILHKTIAENYNINPSILTILNAMIIKKFCRIAIFLSKKI
jgi:3-demethoxyubiquinol 3-hydroxylase